MTTLITTWPDAALAAEIAYRRERLDAAAHPGAPRLRVRRPSRRTPAATALPAPHAVLGDFAVCR